MGVTSRRTGDPSPVETGTVCAMPAERRTAALRRSSDDLRRIATATKENLLARDRLQRVRWVAYQWVFLAASRRLTWRSLPEIFPGIERLVPRCPVDVTHPFELPAGERVVIDLIVQHLQPTTVFEFGTFTGTTTALMARVAPPGGVVHTIDLPTAPDDVIGRAFADPADDWCPIVQHRADVRAFDFSAFEGKVDLVFIDASHAYDQVLADSRIALGLLSEPGVIVWDDFQAAHPGVVAALAELAKDHEITWVLGTRLALLRRA